MPLCLVFERKKGTVCRAGLDRRVQSKCFVAELLSREQKVAHIVVVSFPLHQIKIFFFLFLGGRACSSWTHAGGWSETSAAARGKNKTKQKNKSGISVHDISRPVATDTTTSGVLCSVTDIAEQFIAKLCPHPTFPRVVSKQLPSKAHTKLWQTEREKHRQVYCPWTSCHVNTSTYSLVFVHINYKSEKIRAAGEWRTELMQRQKSKPQAESYLNSGEEQRYCIWLPTCFSPFGKLCW